MCLVLQLSPDSVPKTLSHPTRRTEEGGQFQQLAKGSLHQWTTHCVTAHSLPKRLLPHHNLAGTFFPSNSCVASWGGSTPSGSLISDVIALPCSDNFSHWE
jgi:hypothetical protein